MRQTSDRACIIIFVSRTSTGGLIIGHVFHVCNLLLAHFTANFGRTFSGLGFFLGLTALGISFIKAITETDSLGTGIVVITTPLNTGSISKRVLVGIR